MSRAIEISLKKGDKLNHEGKELSVYSPVRIKVLEARQAITSQTEAKTKAQNSKGEAHSDKEQPIDKRMILLMVEKELEIAKKKENDLLIGGIFGNEELLEEEGAIDASFSVAAHTALGVEITLLKRLSEKIRALK